MISVEGNRRLKRDDLVNHFVYGDRIVHNGILDGRDGVGPHRGRGSGNTRSNVNQQSWRRISHAQATICFQPSKVLKFWIAGTPSGASALF
jgi:hypothetical protein